MSQSRIIITGGTGFAGSHLVELLQKNGESDIHVTNMSSRETFLHSLLPAAAIHRLDLTEKSAVALLIKELQPTHIYHLASAAAVGSSFGQAREVLENHLSLQLNLLEALKEHAPSARVLAIGSGLEYAITPLSAAHLITESHPIGPISPYAVSKALQTLLANSFAHTYDLDIVMVRPFNHIGERQGLGFVVADFAAQVVAIEQGRQSHLKVGNLAAVRDFSDVKDVVRAYQVLMESGVRGEVYNVSSGEGHSVQEILDWLVAAAHTPITIEVDQSKFRPLDIESIVADNGKLRKLGWQPHYQLQETVQRVLEWWRTQPPIETI